MNGGDRPNRRGARRYRLSVPVTLPAGTGTTLNISESGVLFETLKSLTLGDDIEFALLLGQFDPAGPYRVRCAGRVVRVERSGLNFGVAVQLHSYSW